MIEKKNGFKRGGLVLAVLVLVAFLSGCAGQDRTVRLDYQPVVGASGGRGEVYAAVSADHAAQSGEVAWVLGQLRDADGEVQGKLLTDRNPREMVAESLIRELEQAGYRVNLAARLPEGAGRGIDFSRIEAKLDGVDHLVKREVNGSLKVTIDVFKAGKLVKTFKYEGTSSAEALRSDSKVFDQTLLDLVEIVARQAVPELVALLAKSDGEAVLNVR
ncbi:hypothetical protein GMST_25260 [Geomonas silvestris]|uniref:Lipoprotein n=1 Tax=Geomonas silvestris TaxID=2740184 RepID=A0A6V8MJN3_9BACT|nr:hypothetical protein [Geomonas silvestris]GFO60201.1 hypothetical protein GMST_25260 [Geomonas silvestris]